MRKEVEEHKWAFKQFIKIQRTATYVYSGIQGGIDMNFYECYKQYENGIFGYVKERNSFMIAIDIYDYYTANEAWEIISEIEDELGEDYLASLSVEELKEIEKQLETYEE